MRKVEIDEPGDTRFLEQQVVDKQEFMEENDRIWGKKVVVDSGDLRIYSRVRLLLPVSCVMRTVC